MTSRQIIKRLKRDGWELVRITGDHHEARRVRDDVLRTHTIAGAVVRNHPHRFDHFA